jgi:hypothetical protein
MYISELLPRSLANSLNYSFVHVSSNVLHLVILYMYVRIIVSSRLRFDRVGVSNRFEHKILLRREGFFLVGARICLHSKMAE